MSRSMRMVALALLAAGCDKQPAPSVAAEPSPAEPAAEPAASAAEAVATTPAAACTPDAGTQAAVGQAAPVFELTDLDGKTHCLADYRGKAVVIEWFNPQCPFVKFAHTKGPLTDQASVETGNGIVWLAINSGGPGKQGHGVDASKKGVEKFGMQHPVLLDETGSVGHQYGAEKTPHIYLVDPDGTLVYRGAIDNAPFGEVDGDGEYVNYLSAALTNLRAGDAVATAQTPAYGCTVKYTK